MDYFLYIPCYQRCMLLLILVSFVEDETVTGFNHRHTSQNALHFNHLAVVSQVSKTFGDYLSFVILPLEELIPPSK